ncbi:MAG: DnaJ domain-containing protein [Rhodocyclaceae bacterium]|nr:DnaJ domain-containing protein [Rhodocyclaceae bacterium]
MAKQTLYEVLGVKRNADDKDIRAAFQALEETFNADAADQEDVARCNLIREAFRVLGDEALRKAYDESLRREILQAAATEPLPKALPQIVTRGRLIAVALVAVVALIWYAGKARQERLELEQVAAQKAAAERAAEVQRAEYEADRQRREAQEASRSAEYADRQQRYQYERDVADNRWQRDYGYEQRQQAQQNQYNAANEVRRLEQEQRNAEYESKREHQEALRRLEKEKAYLKQLEYENYGWKKDPYSR